MHTEQGDKQGIGDWSFWSTLSGDVFLFLGGERMSFVWRWRWRKTEPGIEKERAKNSHWQWFRLSSWTPLSITLRGGERNPLFGRGFYLHVAYAASAYVHVAATISGVPEEGLPYTTEYKVAEWVEV